VTPGGIVEALDEVKNRHAGRRVRGEAIPVEQLAFQRCEEALAANALWDGRLPRRAFFCGAPGEREDRAMHILAVDLAKQSFHVHGAKVDGEFVSRRVGRKGLPTLVEKLNPQIIARRPARPRIAGRVCS
jgi:hypothetical protein